MDTPFFPHWRAQLSRRLRPLAPLPADQLQPLFQALLPPGLLARSSAGANSRHRHFTLERTFWLFLAQVLKPATACREAVRSAQALLGLVSDQRLDPSSSAYVQARARLPVERLDQALEASAASADQRARAGRRRPIKVVDATSVQLPDTARNQTLYPQPAGQAEGCGFPVMKVMALFSLASGAVLKVVCANLHWHDSPLFRRLWEFLRPGDIVLGDRAFGDFVSLAMLPLRGVDVVTRLHQGRRVDFRKCLRRLGRNDAIFRWARPPARPPHLKRREWAKVPQSIEIRVLRLNFTPRGFRTRVILLSTTLLDPALHPAGFLFDLYQRRWRLELCFRDLKTTMGMEVLRCHSPAMVHKELLMHLIAHNFIRCLMAEAAAGHGVELERISFKGTIDSVRQFSAAIARARNERSRRRLRGELLRNLAEDLVPERPGRREPRAVKRRPKPFPFLNRPRHQYRDQPHRNRCQARKRTS